MFDLCDFLKAKPHLMPLVHSITTVNPSDFALVPLGGTLQNLFELTFTHAHLRVDKPKHNFNAVTVLNRSWSFTSSRYRGARIQTLRLINISFKTYNEFARLLLAFVDVRHLICRKVIIRTEGNPVYGNMVKSYLSRQLHLLTIDIQNDVKLHGKASVAALLLDSGLVQSTVETLIVRPFRSCGLPHPFGWPRLRTLVLRVSVAFTASITGTTVFLTEFPHSTLEDVRVVLESDAMQDILQMLSYEDGSEQIAELEQILVMFRRPQIVCFVGHLRNGRHSFWMQELSKCLPILFQRGALTITPRKVRSGAGHEEAVWAISASPDGKWVATGSHDSTITLWDTTNGAMARQWVAHSYKVVRCIAFSPDGQYLVSGGEDFKVKIWDLVEGLHEAATLVGHTTKYVTHCSWSPCGDIIASASYDHTVRLWDTRTLRPLHVLEHQNSMNIAVIAFSGSDGRWLISGGSSKTHHHNYYHIWNVASGTLQKSFQTTCAGVPAAFDPASSRRLAIALDLGVKLLDVENGKDLAVLESVENSDIRHVAFSPDGMLAVTASDKGMVAMWDAYTGAMLFSLRGHQDLVYQACFSPCGKYVASASYDRTVRLWRVQDGSCMLTFSEHNSPVCHVAFSADGETLWSGDDEGTVIMRRMRDIIPLDEQAPVLTALS